MKKEFISTVAVVLLLGFACHAFTFFSSEGDLGDDHLIMVVYNKNYNEVHVDLGIIGVDFYLTDQDVELVSPNSVDFITLSGVTSIEQLSLAYFSKGYTNTNTNFGTLGLNARFATSSPIAPAFSTNITGDFVNGFDAAAGNIINNDVIQGGDISPVISFGSSHTQGFYNRMNSNGVGLFGGLNLDPYDGEVVLNGTSISMYLYHIGHDGTDLVVIPGSTTEYVATLTLTASGAVILNSSKIDADSDNDGILDIDEDSNLNGIIDTGETDPYNPDTDEDGLLDGQEDANQNGIVNGGESDPLDPDDPCSLINYYVIHPRFTALQSQDTDRVVFFDSSQSACYEMVNCVQESRTCDETWDFGGVGQIVGGNGNDILVFRYDSAGDYEVSHTLTEENNNISSSDNLSITAAIVNTPLPDVGFLSSVDNASVTVTHLFAEIPDRVIVYWGDRNRSEFTSPLPATLEHTYSRTGAQYNIRIKVVNDVTEDTFNYTFIYDGDLAITIP